MNAVQSGIMNTVHLPVRCYNSKGFQRKNALQVIPNIT